MRVALLSLAMLLVACGGGGSSSPADMAVGHDMAFFSVCGHPGDTGNSHGVGKFCQKLSDCAPPAGGDMAGITWAGLCSTLGSDNAYFCTVTCTPPANDMGDSFCGENAYCQCGSGSAQSGCGCYPTSCQ